jgi:hypothetical protein
VQRPGQKAWVVYGVLDTKGRNSKASVNSHWPRWAPSVNGDQLEMECGERCISLTILGRNSLLRQRMQRRALFDLTNSPAASHAVIVARQRMLQRLA